MNTNRPFAGARGQIAWILALVVSTAVIVRLEQVDFGNRLLGLTKNPFNGANLPADRVTSLLARAKADLAARPDDPAARAVLLIALSLAAQGRAVPDSVAATYTTEAESLLATAADDPLSQAAALLAEASFAGLTSGGQ